MDHLWGEGLLGIVTGILTTAILFTARSVWTNQLYPVISALRYRGLKVDGVWEGRETEGETYSEWRLSLKQKAHALSGALTFKYYSPEKEFTLDFDVVGRVWEGYVTLNFSPIDRRITSCATALVKVIGGGSHMAGGFVFRNAELDNVSSVFVRMSRYDRVAGFNSRGDAAPRDVGLSATQTEALPGASASASTSQGAMR